MKNVARVVTCGLCVLGLSACMGEGDDEPVFSNGILTLEVPDDATYAELPAGLQSMVDEVITSNTNSGAATQPASGASTYSGTFGMSIGEDGALASGAANLSVDASADIDYTFTVSSLQGADNPDATLTGSFGGSGSVAGGYFDGGLAGTLSFDADGASGGSAPQAANISGNLTGAFDANGDGFGGMSGTIGADDEFTGLFHTTLD